MAKTNDGKKAFSTRLYPDLIKKMKSYANRNGLKAGWVLEQALIEYLSKDDK